MIIHGDCLDELKKLPENSVDSMLTDPPAGISFMGKSWDSDKGGRDQWIAWMKDIMQECLRVMKPGAHGFVWALPRTSHWTATALENAGFEVRDICTHLFGSGFPKSHNISKAIDKMMGAEREVIGENPNHRKTPTGEIHETSTMVGEPHSGDGSITAPSTPEAKQYDGWGTALKPASEHWILIRKPISEDTIAANVLKWGCAGLNIDASRINAGSELEELNRPNKRPSIGASGFMTSINRDFTPSQGRFPSNLLLSHSEGCVEVGVKKVKAISGGTGDTDTEANQYKFGNGKPFHYGNPDGTETVAAWDCEDSCAVRMLDAQSGNLGKSAGGNDKYRGGYQFKDSGKGKPCGFGDSGGASRFFYCAKASKSEKNAGCDLEVKKAVGDRPNSGDPTGKFPDHDQRERIGNFHPTVKPLKLMSYLITMITPPGGTCIDPFLGSGSTGVAAIQSGFKFIGIEKESEYIEIAKKRIEHAPVLVTVETIMGSHKEFSALLEADYAEKK